MESSCAHALHSRKWSFPYMCLPATHTSGASCARCPWLVWPGLQQAAAGGLWTLDLHALEALFISRRSLDCYNEKTTKRKRLITYPPEHIENPWSSQKEVCYNPKLVMLSSVMLNCLEILEIAWLEIILWRFVEPPVSSGFCLPCKIGQGGALNTFYQAMSSSGTLEAFLLCHVSCPWE